MKVPAGTQRGTTVKVRGRGIAPAKGEPGDLLVTFEVVVPEAPDRRAAPAVEALAERVRREPRAHLGV